MSSDDRLSSYDYDLPEDRIAAVPLPERDASRLMVLRRDSQTIEHRRFAELPDLLSPGDLLILNETRVVPARLAGFRKATGGRWEGLFLSVLPDGRWRLMGQTRGKLQTGESLVLRPIHAERGGDDEGFELVLDSREPDGLWTAHPLVETDPLLILDRYGSVPLPPYMHRDVADANDWERYQTTFATRPGAVAAPTAGLHFTEAVFSHCRERGIQTATVTLHVGIGTFRPISVESLADHAMHWEWCELPAATVAAIEATKARGGRVVAVGTTSVRTLESVAARGPLEPWSGETNLFIRPPYEFRAIDAMVTNFHLPQSSLLVLVSAFAGREFVLRAYEAAIAERYRFYSYGDAMLIL